MRYDPRYFENQVLEVFFSPLNGNNHLLGDNIITKGAND